MVEIFTKKHRGFTLIELLVVIAIIGILASIVLVSLGGTRARAQDAAIKANMDSMRLACEMYFTDNLTYTNCSTDPSFTAAQTAAEANGASFTINFKADGTAYCIQSTLVREGSWCVDSAGSVGSSDISCDATNADCKSE